MNTFSLKNIKFFTGKWTSHFAKTHICLLCHYLVVCFSKLGFTMGIVSDMQPHLILMTLKMGLFSKNFLSPSFFTRKWKFREAKSPCPPSHGQKKVEPGFEPRSVWTLLMISWFQGSGGRHSHWVSANVSTPWIISSSRTEGGKRRRCSVGLGGSRTSIWEGTNVLLYKLVSTVCRGCIE